MKTKIAATLLLALAVLVLSIGAASNSNSNSNSDTTSTTSRTGDQCVIHRDAPQFIVCTRDGIDFYILTIADADYVHLATVHAFYSNPKDQSIDTLYIPLDVFIPLMHAFNTLAP